MELVGHLWENSADLLPKLSEAEPDLVIVDCALGGRYLIPPKEVVKDPAKSGLAAIRGIRKAFGSRVKIIAVSTFPYEFRARSIKAGANEFLSKATPNDDFRDTIRILVGRPAEGSGPSPDIGMPIGLELVIEDESFQLKVIGERSVTPLLRLEPVLFVFASYLAAAQVTDLDVAVTCTGPQCFAAADLELWSAVARAIKEGGLAGDHLPAPVWRTKLNAEVATHIPTGAVLVHGPGDGVDGYTLAPTIEKSRITFPGFPKWLLDRINRS